MPSQKINNHLGFQIENNVIKGVELKFQSKDYNVGNALLDVFDQRPEHVGQIDAETGEKTTYAEMKENSIRCALWMQKQGIGSGDVVAMCTHNQLDDYIPFVATFLTGAILNPWHHEVSLKTARYLMNLTKPKIIFATKSAKTVLEEAARLEEFDTRIVVFKNTQGIESIQDIIQSQRNDEIESFTSYPISDPNHEALILFSSGTTGMPKGVAHSYRSLFSILISSKYLPQRNTSSLWYNTLYWVTGTICVLRTIGSNSIRIIHVNFHPNETCKVIEKYNVGSILLSPNLTTYLYKARILDRYKLESLHNIFIGGAKLARKTLEEFRAKLPHAAISQTYGMTEVIGPISTQTSECQRIDSVGFIAPNVQLKIVDQNSMDTLGPNKPGEICIKSANVMLEYYKNPSATRAIIDEEGWLHTGDEGYYCDNGELFVTDRLKEVVKFRGHQISPSEVEELLISHPGVAEVAVISVPHEVDVEHLMAFVKRINGAKVTQEELVELSLELGEYKKLRGGVHFLDKLPYTASGKISRNALKEIAKSLLDNTDAKNP